MVNVKTPINTDEVKERAARNLSRFNAKQKSKNVKNITGNIVKPIQLSKSEPLVRRMTNFQKSN